MAYLNSFSYNSFDRSKPPFQPSSSYTSFPTTPIEEPTYLEKSIESMIQSPNDPFDRLEEKIDRMQG